MFRLRPPRRAPQPAEPTELFPLNEMARTFQAGIAVGLRYELSIDSSFTASHAMRPGGPVHSHAFRVQAQFSADSLDDGGMMCGFREVSGLLAAQAKRYADKLINDIEPFHIIQPTGENIATVMLRNLHVGLLETMPFGPKLIAVTLWENPESYVRVGMVEAA